MPLDICNLDLYYNENYEFSFPRNLLDSYLHGKAFDHSEEYTESERLHLMEGIRDFYQSNIEANQENFPRNPKIAYITVGSPGTGKTTKLHQIFEKNRPIIFPYSCPDDVCLLNMPKYVEALKESDGTAESRLKIYKKYRPFSFGFSMILVANFVLNKWPFYFGTTGSSPKISSLFEFLKKHEYQIHLLHFSAPEGVRYESIQKRDQDFIQTTAEDIKSKGVDVPQRIATYLEHATTIDFYFRGTSGKDAVLAATWKKNESSSPFKGTLQIFKREEYAQIGDTHNTVINSLPDPSSKELLWENAVERTSQIWENVPQME